MMELPEEQGYVFGIAAELGIEAKLVEHPYPTVTCREKAELLGGWPLDRVIKTVYFRSGGHVVGVVTPELGRDIDKESVLSALGIPRKKARSYTPTFMPSGMMRGTCTPFPYEYLMGYEIDGLIVCDHKSLDDKVVDVSVGGCDDEALRTSMHIPYGAIYGILSRQFGECVVKHTEAKDERCFSRSVQPRA